MVKIYKILKRQNVLVIILQYIGKNKLIIVSNYLSFQNLFCENAFKECLFYFILFLKYKTCYYVISLSLNILFQILRDKEIR